MINSHSNEKRIRIGLLGFGRTGFSVALGIAKDDSLELAWVMRKKIPVDNPYASYALGYSDAFAPFVAPKMMNQAYLNSHPVDMVIDFSNSHSAKEYYDLFAKNQIKIVSAISNYQAEELAVVKEISKSTPLLYSPNITLGINWVMIASKILRQIIPQADVEIVEEHFRDKKDISGTALKLAQHLDLDPKTHVNSIRVGGILGRHEVIFGLPFQTIRLEHETISREAFGTGAIFAAKWLQEQKKPGLFSMEDVFKDKFFLK